MTNEDAIKWLDNLKNDLGNLRYEYLWPYAQAIDEICELLEEKEPRVYTYDEMNKLDDNLIEVVWFEAHNFAYITPMFTRDTNFENESSDWFKYGRDWRCWSARPTAEQREAVKWDE